MNPQDVLTQLASGFELGSFVFIVVSFISFVVQNQKVVAVDAVEDVTVVPHESTKKILSSEVKPDLPTLEDLKKLTLVQLRELGIRFQIRNAGRMKKSVILPLIEVQVADFWLSNASP